MKLKPQTFLIREPNPNPEPQTLNPELGTQNPHKPPLIQGASQTKWCPSAGRPSLVSRDRRGFTQAWKPRNLNTPTPKALNP